jgi:hypothetical protein
MQLRQADALPVARENARRTEEERIKHYNTEEAKAERRVLTRKNKSPTALAGGGAKV